MANRWVLAVVGAFSISLLTVGSGGAAAVVCNPLCAPAPSSGMNQAGSVANQNALNTGLPIAQTQTGTTPGPCSGC
jgi:hypothetical protein